MSRHDLGALASGGVIGAVVALMAVLIWTELSQPAPFPTTTVGALPTRTVAPSPTTRSELPLKLETGGLGLVAFGEEGDAVIGELSRLLGTPNEDDRWTCPDPPGEVQFLRWADLGVFVIDGVFVGWVDALYFPSEDGALLELLTTEDLHIGIMWEHFQAHLGDRIALREPDPNAGENAARGFDIDGPDGIHGLVEDAPDGPRVISLSAGTTCFDDNP